ncbi:hypothetical protein SGP3_0005 (plasmid) [Sodalis glossinidius str. 'morsitans']|uniref:Uncharacterized protein n=1 Tax=Sodalis glossinidius (strain morsitans) TaxID=343509 RepID=Q2NPY6_SODGM|nr:hypothetical protein SGP3_0005 [Sodalis glossinidius str. 'morsitans']
MRAEIELVGLQCLLWAIGLNILHREKLAAFAGFLLLCQKQLNRHRGIQQCLHCLIEKRHAEISSYRAECIQMQAGVSQDVVHAAPPTNSGLPGSSIQNSTG